MTALPPRGPLERDLERQQKMISEGESAREKRNRVAFELWQSGMTQGEIAERLDRADRGSGGSGVTLAATQKMLYQYRKRNEQALLDAASS